MVDEKVEQEKPEEDLFIPPNNSNYLYFAQVRELTHDGIEVNIFYFYVNEKQEHVSGFVAKRAGLIEALCSHNGEIYDVVDKRIYRTLKDREGTSPRAAMPEEISALCSHNGELYCSSGSSVFNVLEDSSGKRPIAERPKGIGALCSHNGELYYASGHCVFNTFKDRKGENPIAERPKGIAALCSNNGELYDAVGNKVFNTLRDRKGTNPIAERPYPILVLCSHNGELYDAGSRTIDESKYEDPVQYGKASKTLKNIIYDVGYRKFITAMVSHRR